MKIAHFGTFDVENYGDLLFPLLLERRLGGSGLEFLHISPVGGAPDLADCKPTIGFREALMQCETWDAIVVAGGALGHGETAGEVEKYANPAIHTIAYPGLWLLPALVSHVRGIPLVWNATGVPGAPTQERKRRMLQWAAWQTEYISVRDKEGAAALAESAIEANVVPDTALEVSKLWTEEELASEIVRLRDRGNWPASRYLALHLREWFCGSDPVKVADNVKKICASQNAAALLISIGGCHGDEAFARRILEHLEGLNAFVLVPDSLRSVAAAIRFSAGYVGSSLHGAITAYSFSRPFLLVADSSRTKFAGFLRHIQTTNLQVPDWGAAAAAIGQWEHAPADRRQLDGGDKESLFQSLDQHWELIASALTKRKTAPPQIASRLLETIAGLPPEWFPLLPMLEKSPLFESILKQHQSAWSAVLQHLQDSAFVAAAAYHRLEQRHQNLATNVRRLNSRIEELLAERQRRKEEWLAERQKMKEERQNLLTDLRRASETVTETAAKIAHLESVVSEQKKRIAETSKETASEISRLEGLISEQKEHIADRDTTYEAAQKAIVRLKGNESQLRDAVERRNQWRKELQERLEASEIARNKLVELLKKAGKEIDRLVGSSRWKIGSFLTFRKAELAGGRAKDRLMKEYKDWAKTLPALNANPATRQTSSDVATVRESSPAESLFSKTPELRGFKNETIDPILEHLARAVSIVVPVYNYPQDLQRCVESILKHTNTPFEVIIVDDCSPDPAIPALLDSYRSRDVIRIIRNDTNHGFVRSANAGMRACSHDVVLLNSDTEVTPRWLQKLTIAAYSDARIATVTPFSNAAGAFSVPEVGVNVPLPFPFTPLKMARLTERLSAQAYPEVPTGNGFCMFIKRQALEEVGAFDEENFGRGYGEENDFCMRACKRGWRHVIDDSLFIYHRGNSSFGEEKQALLVRNRETLNRLHPEYTGLVREFTGSVEINAMRSRIGEGLQKSAAELHLDKRRLLYILHEGSGGVPMTNADLASKTSDAQQCFLLTSTGADMILSEWRGDRAVQLKRWKLPNPTWSAENFTQPDMREIYFEVLVGLGIDLVHVRHLFKHSFDAPLLCRALGIPIVLSFHDYYFVCPSIHLLDQNAKFCGGKCTPGLQQCTIPSRMLENLPMLKGFIPQWREQVAQVFDCCDAFVTTAESVRDVHLSAFPQLNKKPFWVIEHGRNLHRETGVASPPRPGKPIRILAAGNIDRHKGSGFIRRLKELDTEELLEFHFLGKTDETLNGIGVHHGAYRREDFEKLAREIQPSFAAVLSIWGETFSHTLTEAWAVGLPVLGTKLGAVGERIARHGGGWVVDTTDPTATLAQIRAIANGNGIYQKAVREVETIQFHTVEEMADAYRALYEKVLAKRRLIDKPAVGCLVPAGDRGSTFMRVTVPLAHEKMQERLFATRLPAADAHNSLGKWIDRLELRTVFLQREALQQETAAAVIETCRTKKVRVVFEIDDNLLDVAVSHADYAFYESKVETIRYLAQNADQVIVSTPKLLEIFRPLNERICVIGNAIDEWLWFSPLPLAERTTPDHTVVAGYMGTKTHRADLQMIREPFLRARERLESERNLRLELQIVGGLEDEPSAPRWYQRLEVPQGCAAYPRFVRWLRQNARWDFALAPLCDEPLNQSKSALKFFEYSGLGVPGIFSSVGEYPAIIQNRETGLLAASNGSEDWENLIFELATSPSLRQTLAANARRKTQEQFILGKTIPAWLALLGNDSCVAPG